MGQEEDFIFAKIFSFCCRLLDKYSACMLLGRLTSNAKAVQKQEGEDLQCGCHFGFLFETLSVPRGIYWCSQTGHYSMLLVRSSLFCLQFID